MKKEKRIQRADHKENQKLTVKLIVIFRQLRHENVIELKDIMMPPHRKNFKDVYLVYELMHTDLHQIINSPLSLSDEYIQCFLCQVKVCRNQLMVDLNGFLETISDRE